MSEINVYKITAKALEKMDELLLKSMLQLVQRQLNATWRLEDNAEIVLVDTEQPEGQAFWQTHLSNKLLVSYAKQNHYQAQWFLAKPIRVQPLVHLLNTMESLNLSKGTTQSPPLEKPAKISSRQTAPKPSGTPTQVEAIPPPVVAPISLSEALKKQTLEQIGFPNLKNTFEPSQYLLGLLLNALNTNQITRFSHPEHTPIYLLPSEKRCFTITLPTQTLNNSQKKFYETAANHIQVEHLSREKLLEEVEHHHLKPYPLETILWLSALLASQGRWLAGYSQYMFIRLKRWPNFAILPHQPLHMNLAAFMLKKTADLSTIANKTQVPFPVVVDFFNACKIIGLINEEPKAPPPSILLENTDVPDQKRTLLKGILKKLLQ